MSGSDDDRSGGGLGVLLACATKAATTDCRLPSPLAMISAWPATSSPTGTGVGVGVMVGVSVSVGVAVTVPVGVAEAV